MTETGIFFLDATGLDRDDSLPDTTAGHSPVDVHGRDLAVLGTPLQREACRIRRHRAHRQLFHFTDLHCHRFRRYHDVLQRDHGVVHRDRNPLVQCRIPLNLDPDFGGSGGFCTYQSARDRGDGLICGLPGNGKSVQRCLARDRIQPDLLRVSDGQVQPGRDGIDGAQNDLRFLLAAAQNQHGKHRCHQQRGSPCFHAYGCMCFIKCSNSNSKVADKFKTIRKWKRSSRRHRQTEHAAPAED